MGSESMGSEAAPTRPLTPREEAVLVAMVHAGTCADDDDVISAEARARWLAQVPTTRAGQACTCGTCPSIELVDVTGSGPDMKRSRVVLGASAPGALLLLFIDDDRLSYLELAPLNDSTTFHQFPAAADLDFG